MTMTAKRKDNGDLEVIQLGRYTVTYRTALMLVALSLTPIGNKLWVAVGLDTVATLNASNVEKKVEVVEKRLDRVEAKVDDVHDDLQKMSVKFTGFVVDFDKYKKEKVP